MISTEMPQSLRHTDIHRNVSSNIISLIPQDIRANYKGKSISGVYTAGELISGRELAIAVTGMASCGGLILLSNSSYLAIHLGGDARMISEFESEIREWVGSNEKFIVVGATGPSGSEDRVLNSFNASIIELTGKQDREFVVYKNVAAIAVSSKKEVGIPTIASIRPVTRRRGKCTIL